MLENDLTSSIPGNEDVASRNVAPDATCSLHSPSIPTPRAVTQTA